MNTDNLMILVSTEGSNKSYAITCDTYATYVDVIHHDKDNAHYPFGGEFEHIDDALYNVLGAEIDANGGQEQSFTVKAFKRLENTSRIEEGFRVDISRAWVIDFNVQNGEYRVSTEVDGFKGKSPSDIKGIDNGVTLTSLGSAVDFVAFLEKVYTEHNSQVGKKTATLGAIYDKAQDILAKPFDAADLKLTSKKDKAEVER